MRKFLCLVALLLAVGCSRNWPVETFVTDDDKVLQQILEKADKNTLVIFDCDEVLITPTDTLFSPANKSNYKKAKLFNQNKAESQYLERELDKIINSHGFQS